MKHWLTVKNAGLPRWAWLSLFSGAVVVGLYLRNRAKSEEASTEPISEGEGLGAYNGTEMGAGLAAAGLTGTPAATAYPVETPMLPEGIVDIMGQLADLASELGHEIVEREESRAENSNSEVTGGGPPEGGVHINVQQSQGEISRLEGEISSLQADVDTLTKHIKDYKSQFSPLSKYPKAAKQVREWEAKRAKDQGSIAAKRAKLNTLKVLVGHAG
jgi:hypothetical protein